MHLLKSVFAASALVAVVVAQSKIQFTEWPSSLQAGQPATVKWTGGEAGTVRIAAIVLIVSIVLI